jgi:hypothetical protein
MAIARENEALIEACELAELDALEARLEAQRARRVAAHLQRYARMGWRL